MKSSAILFAPNIRTSTDNRSAGDGDVLVLVLYESTTSTRIGRTVPLLPQAVRANSLFKLENRNRTRLVQKPNWTETQGQK
jgi:hypothetical protein